MSNLVKCSLQGIVRIQDQIIFLVKDGNDRELQINMEIPDTVTLTRLSDEGVPKSKRAFNGIKSIMLSVLK